jgi:hypothetical protein
MTGGDPIQRQGTMSSRLGCSAWLGLCYVTVMALGCANNERRGAAVPFDAASADRADAAGVPDWAEAMGKWSGSPDNSIYSLNYYAPPPDGLMIRAVSYASQPGDACTEYPTRQQTPPDDWMLQVLFSRDETGSFEVRPITQAGGDLAAHVLVIRSSGGREVERHTGLAGLLQVDSVALTAAEQLAGASFVVHGDVAFSTNEADAVDGCAISGGDDFISATCQCRATNGVTFTCDSDQVDPSCCVDVRAPRVTFHIALGATPCPALCATTDLALLSYCAGLDPGRADAGVDGGTRITL